MRNLPLDLTDHGLQFHLKPLMIALHIKDWDCQKGRKKPFGSITFLRHKDGQNFLSKYEQEATNSLMSPKPQFKARMKILDRPVFCTISNKEPDPLLLRCLTKAAEDRRKTNDLPLSTENAKIVFQAKSLSCGLYNFVNDELSFSPEIDWHFVTGYAKFVKKALIIEYEDGNGGRRLEIPFRIVDNIVATSRPTTALILTLWEAPRLFEKHADDLSALLSSFPNQRITSTKTRLKGLPSNVSSHEKIVGQALVYRICVSPVEFYGLSNRLIQRDVISIIRHDITIQPSHRQLSLRTGFELLNETVKKASQTVPFAVLFQIEALARNNYLPPWTVQNLLLKIYDRIQEHKNSGLQTSGLEMSEKLLISAEAVRKLISQISFPGVESNSSDFDVEELWYWLEENEKEIQSGAYTELITEKGRANLTMVHKVNVTPTGITLHGPDPEAKNRILRRFPDHPEYFIRVQFCEEDGSDLQFNSRVSNDEIYDRFKQIMINGIAICGRVYGFLGYSHSSLRSHSSWFVAPFWHQNRLETYFTIIPTLGSFAKIQSPARCAARIGQAFSETPFAISLPYNDIRCRKLPDITSQDGRHMFSDGVGTLSLSAVEAIRDSIPRKKGAATCFQIRWAGAKGMLALDTRLEGSTMNVRNSMVKFESDATEYLEICDTANKPIPLVLNRQVSLYLKMQLPSLQRSIVDKCKPSVYNKEETTLMRNR